MAEFIFTSPDGQKFKVSGPDGSTPEQAFKMFQQSQGMAAPRTPSAAPQEAAIPQGDWSALKDRIQGRVAKERGIIGPVREQDLAEVAKAEAAKQGLLYGKQYGKGESGVGVALGAAANTFGMSLPRLAEAYIGQSQLPGAQAHEFLKAADRGRAEAQPGAATAGVIGGAVGQALTLPVSGAATLGGRALAAGVQAGLVSAVDKAAETRGDLGQTVLAGGVGAGLGVIGSVMVDKGIQLGRKLIDPMRGLAKSGPIDQQANARLLLAAKAAGIDEATAKLKLAELGPDGFVADILGKRGTALARTSANLSPDAREIITGASNARLGGQTERLSGALRRAGGIGEDTPKSLIEGIKRADQPKIAAAYADPKQAGFSMLGKMTPEGGFEVNAVNDAVLQDLFNVKRVQAALKQAQEDTAARVAINGPSEASQWAILDSARQILANEGFKNNDSVAKGLAKRLNEALDLMVPQGAAARGVAQQSMRAREAVDLGAAAARNPTSDFGKNIAARQLPMDQIGQGYAAQQIETLLSTKGGGIRAIDKLDGSANARKVLAEALGAKSAPVQKQIAAERQFVNFDRELQGNSTTARQLAEMGLTGLGTGGAAYSVGFDPQTAFTIGGLSAMAKRGGSKLLEALARKNESAVAPEVARKLIARELPKLLDSQGKPLTETARRRLAEALLRQSTRGAVLSYGMSQ